MTARGRPAFLAALAGLALLTLAAFWPVGGNGFLLLDDNRIVTGNAVVLRGLTREGLVLAFTRSYASNWNPLTWVSHMVDVELFGLDPRGHHLMSLAIHAAGSLALLGFLRAATGSLRPALLAAALFAVHPLRVESVAWAAERKDVLCGLFWMLALAAWLGYARRPSAGRYTAALALFAAALMSKAIAVTLPLVLLALDWWPLGRIAPGGAARTGPGARRLLLEKVPFLALSLLAGLAAVAAQRAGGAMVSLAQVTPAERVANALLSVVRYLGRTVWPSGLAVYYPYVRHGLGEPAVVAAGAAALGVTLLAVRSARRSPWLAAGWGWYLVTLAPVLGILQVGRQAMADRFTYLPLAGLFVAVAWTLEGAWRRLPRPALLALPAAAAVLALTLATRHQSALWHDGVTLFRHALAVTRDNAKAAYNLGIALEAAGDPAAALPWYREAARLDPASAKVRFSLGVLLQERGEAAEALARLTEAVRLAPGDPVMRMTLARALQGAGREEEAQAVARGLLTP